MDERKTGWTCSWESTVAVLKTSQNVGAAVMQKLLDSVMYCSEGYLVIQDLAKKFNLFGPMFDDHILNSFWF